MYHAVVGCDIVFRTTAEGYFSPTCSLPESGSIVESILENTLLNILKEASAEELNITAPVYNIVKPTP